MLLWANVILFFVTGFGRNLRSLSPLWLHPDYIRDFQVWRLLTYMFVHAGWGHLFVNMWGLFLFGRALEDRLGPARFMYLYLTSGLVGGLVWLAANWSPRALPVVGASGAVFGVMVAAAMVYPNMMIMLLIPPIPMRLKTFVCGYAIIEILMAISQAKNRGGGIAHIAHLGGILGGYLYMRRLGAPHLHVMDLFDPLRRKWGQWRAGSRRRRFQVTEPPDEADDGLGLGRETDRILDKIGEHGVSSLTAEERRTLDRARERLRDRR
jgi:membrane associated rhomboid family serine protease